MNVPRSFDSHNRRSDHDVLLRPRQDQRPQQRPPPPRIEEEEVGNGLDYEEDEGRRRRMPYGEDEDVVRPPNQCFFITNIT